MTDGVIEGVTDGVIVFEGVIGGVEPGLLEGVTDGVTDGVTEGLTLIDGVIDGVIEGVTLIEGVIDGVGVFVGVTGKGIESEHSPMTEPRYPPSPDMVNEVKLLGALILNFANGVSFIPAQHPKPCETVFPVNVV